MDKGAETMIWVEEFEGQLCAPFRTKRKYRSKKREFVGWGSKQLIEFLQAFDKDTSKKLSQYDVTDIINEYARVNNLQHPQKKKRIVCDDNLHSLFGRKTIGRNKIHDLLAVHFAENQEDSDDDFFYSSDEREENILPTSEQIKLSTPERKPHRKKVNLGPPKSCFAAIVPENIKLVYLRRSVVSDLLKDPETFEHKMTGSFIRIKCDPNDFLQKNSHQLLQVAGVKNIPGTDKEILLQVYNSIKDVQMCMLSDDNFSEEECKDLDQRMKDGLLKKPTIGDLEGKAQTLHVDLTKHWLARELTLLQNRIDRANEKGWRREVPTLHEYLERRKLLQTPAEQTRLFSEFPKVVAEEMEAATIEDVPGNPEQEQNDSPRSFNIEASVCQPTADDNVPTWISSENQCATFVPDEQKQPQKMLSFDNMQLLDVTAEATGYGSCEARVDGKVVTTQVIAHEGSQGMNKQAVTSPLIEHKGSESLVDKKVVITEVIDLSESLVDKKAVITEVIDLSDDDEENEPPSGKNQSPVGSLMWHYADPQGDIQGPFSLSLLKQWSDANYFPPDFMVWSKGQSQDEAVLVRDVLAQAFPNK